MSRREQELRRARRAPARDAVRIAGEDRAEKRSLPIAPPWRALRPPASRRHLLQPARRRHGRAAAAPLDRPRPTAGRSTSWPDAARWSAAPTAARTPARPRGCPPDSTSMRARRGCSGSRFMRCAERRDLAVAHRAELLEQRERGVHAIRRRRVEPLERPADCRPTRGCRARRRTDRRGGSPARRAAAADRLDPTAGGRVRDRRGRRGRPAGRRRPRESARAPASRSRGPVVARDLVQPGVDDGGHAGNRERRLGDVRRENHARPRTVRGDRAILLVRRQRSVQRHDVDAGSDDGRGRPAARD